MRIILAGLQLGRQAAGVREHLAIGGDRLLVELERVPGVAALIALPAAADPSVDWLRAQDAMIGMLADGAVHLAMRSER
jgi:hypothetical protein